MHTSPLDTPGTKDAGGMNVVVLAQAAELARLGHRVQLITRRSDAALPDAVRVEDGLVVHHLDAGPPRLLPKGDHEALILPFGAALQRHLEDHPADLLHAEHWYSGLAALPVARELGIPLVQSYHSIAAGAGAPLGDGERSEAAGRLEGERLLAREADLVVTVSEAEKQTVLERLSGEALRVRVVWPGVDTQLFRPCGGCGEASEQCKACEVCGVRGEVLVAGRLDPLKRFDLAIDAVAAIDPQHRPLLRVVGASPPDGAAYADSLRDAVAEAGMTSTTVFEGALDRTGLAERLRHASLVLIPSYSETYGLVALEAAASGLPVIASSTGGLREAVVDGETGVLLESGDPLVWASEIERLLGDPSLLARMGAAARAHALRHSWAASTERLIALYRELLAG